MAATRDVVEKFAQAMAGDRAALEESCSPDIEFNDGSAVLSGIEQVRQFVATWLTALPDAKVTLLNVIESGEQGAAELTYSGTHTGPLATPQGEIPATGKPVSIPGAGFLTVREGKVVRFHGYYDQLAFMAQLGLAPQAASA